MWVLPYSGRGSTEFSCIWDIAMNDWSKDRVFDSEPLVAMAGEYRSSLYLTRLEGTETGSLIPIIHIGYVNPNYYTFFIYFH